MSTLHKDTLHMNYHSAAIQVSEGLIRILTHLYVSKGKEITYCIKGNTDELSESTSRGYVISFLKKKISELTFKCTETHSDADVMVRVDGTSPGFALRVVLATYCGADSQTWLTRKIYIVQPFYVDVILTDHPVPVGHPSELYQIYKAFVRYQPSCDITVESSRCSVSSTPLKNISNKAPIIEGRWTKILTKAKTMHAIALRSGASVSITVSANVYIDKKQTVVQKLEATFSNC